MRPTRLARLLALSTSLALSWSCSDGGTSTPEVLRLAFATAPSNAVAGSPLDVVEVRVVDADGNVVTGSSASITLAIVDGTGPAGALLDGTPTRAAVAGVATFDDLAIEKAGTGYRLSATASDLQSTTSAAFTVAHGVVDRLVFGSSPSAWMAGEPAALQVRFEDAFGNTATGVTDPVTLALTGGTAGAQLAGTPTGAAQGGVATFDDLSIDRSGTAYALVASAAGVPDVTSASFDVSASVRFVIGASQTGIEGVHPLSTLVIEAQDPIGTFLQSAPVVWTASGGTLTSMSPVTNTIGRAQAAWRLGAGTQTLTATVAGGTAVTTATGLAPAPCTFHSPAGHLAFPPRDTLRFQPLTRTVRVAALFIDFPDLPATRTIPEMMDDIVNPAVELLGATTDDALQLEIVPTASWMRMPESANDLRPSESTSHLAYIDTILARHDATYDFSTIDVVWVFRSSHADPMTSGTATFFKGSNVIPPRDGREMKSFVTFGGDVHSIDVDPNAPFYGVHVVAHEMGHVYALPDLYAYESAPGEHGLRFTGGWSFMGWVGPGTSWTAAERYYLGALPESDVLCPPNQPFGALVTLRPIEETSGLRAIGLRSTSTRMTWLESRQSLGVDAGFCSTGLLVYDVNGAEALGNGPIVVREIHPSPPGPEEDRCSVKWNAPAQVGDTIHVGDPPVTVVVLPSAPGDLGMRLSIRRQ